MAKKILAWNDSAGQFYRELGKREDGKAVRYYLGADEKNAAANVARLEGLWRGVEERWQDFNEEELAVTSAPCWDDLTYSLGRAIAKGDWSITVDSPEQEPEEIAAWVAGLQVYFPMIRVEVEEPKKMKLAEGNNAFVQAGQNLKDRVESRYRRQIGKIKDSVAPFGGKIVTQETLHDSLDAYKVWIEKKFVDIEGRTTQTGKKQGERAERIKRNVEDMALSDFGIPEIEVVIEFWRVRPKKKDGKPYSFSLCKHTIRLFKHFLKWLHKEQTFPWKKPVDLEFDRLDIVPDKEIKFKVETYSKEELAILWQHATFFERQLLLLALNCGFSISEIGNFDWKEIDGNFHRGLRPKTKVYGEFQLWDLTRTSLGASKDKGLVFVTKTGRSLIAPTAGNNLSRYIPNAWNRLLRRVRKYDATFKQLGFHHLRKTAGNFIRRLSDGETMGVFLRHKSPVKTDVLSEVYSNPAFQKVFDAQQRLWELLSDIFTPIEEVELPRKVSPAKIRQIRSLRMQGFTVKHLSESFGISTTTIRTYCRLPKQSS